MTIRLTFLGATAALALTACGSAKDPAANFAANDVNALDPAAEQNAVAIEAPETDIVAEPVAAAPAQPAAKAPEPTKAESVKPSPPPAPEPTEPESTDPTCAPEHRAAGHC